MLDPLLIEATTRRSRGGRPRRLGPDGLPLQRTRRDHMSRADRPPTDRGPGRPRKDPGSAVDHTDRTLSLAQRSATLKAEGLSNGEIAAMLDSDVSATRVGQLLVIARQAALVSSGEAVLARETEHLERLREAALEVLEARCPLVSAGAVVTDDVIDPATGQPVIDPRTGQQLRVKLRDMGATLAAVKTLISIGERLSRLRGLDAPKRSEVTQTPADPGSVLQGLTRDDFRDLMAQALRQSRAIPSAVGSVTDVEALPALEGPTDGD
jgi:hypothetical protein